MPADGYRRKDFPDMPWWREQAQQGIKFRKKFAHEEKWATWRDYYRGNWKGGILPKNIFFSMLRTTVPRIYFRNPAVSVSPAQPGFINMAFARVLDRVDNRSMRIMKIKQQMKLMVQDSFLYGTGIGKLGYGSQFSSTIDDSSLEASSRAGERVEYNPQIQPDMPWFRRIKPGNFIVPMGLDSLDNARWCAEWIRRPLADVKADPRLKGASKLGPTSKMTTPDADTESDIDMVDLLEIHDAKFRKVMVIPALADLSEPLFFGHDEFQDSGGFNYFPITFNTDDEVFWGIPDSQQLEPLQLEANEIKTQIMRHRRAALVKILAKEGTISESEATKIFEEDVPAIIFTKENPREILERMQVSNIPQDLFLAEDRNSQDVRDTIGFSRNQAGEFNSRSGDTTATEAQIVQQGSEIRVDERRDMMADMLTDVIHKMHPIIFENWSETQVQEIVGPGGTSLWVQFTGPMLKMSKYHVRVDPESGQAESHQVREARAAQMYQLLKSNPLIDPAKLTQYLLSEIKGVQIDELMKLLPPPNQQPNGPVSPGEAGKLIEGSVRQAQGNGASQG